MTRTLAHPRPKGGPRSWDTFADPILGFPAGHLWLYGFGRNRNPLPAQVAGFFDRSDYTSPGRRPRPIHGNVNLPCVDAPTFKDAPRSVRSQFDDCPISM
jgi:hypothetical protein